MEIKFRGLELDSPVCINWVYGYYIEKSGEDFNGSPIVRYYIHDGYEDFEVAPDTVGQFTGLHDKNGKEIYKDDIVEFDADEWGDNTSNKHLVTWVDREASFCFGGGLNHENEYRTVIGNKFENPELLK